MSLHVALFEPIFNLDSPLWQATSSASRETSPSLADSSSSSASANAGPLIVFRNMIAAEDIDDDFQGEVKEELEQFGKVDQVFVYTDLFPAKPEVWLQSFSHSYPSVLDS